MATKEPDYYTEGTTTADMQMSQLKAVAKQARATAFKEVAVVIRSHLHQHSKVCDCGICALAKCLERGELPEVKHD